MSELSLQLSFRARHKLASILDQPNIRGCDWRSVVELMGFSYEMVMMLRNKESPTMSLLEEWELREGSSATIDSLIAIMEELGNGPAIETLKNVKEENNKKLLKSKSPVSSYSDTSYQVVMASKKLTLDPVNYDGIPTSVANSIHAGECSIEKQLKQGLQTLSIATDRRLTEGEDKVAFDPEICEDSLREQFRGRKLSILDQSLLQGHEFDVFLSFAADDLDFAIEMRLRLVHRARISVYIASEGLMAGQSFQDEIADKIKRGCNKTIIILSPDYINCSWCNYEARLAHFKNPDPRRHHLIPVMYRECKVPDFISYLYYLDYPRYKNDPKKCEQYFWERLYKSVRHQPK